MQVELNKEDIIHLLKGTEPATYGIQVIREEELIDACVEMIIKLNEQKLL